MKTRLIKKIFFKSEKVQVKLSDVKFYISKPLSLRTVLTTVRTGYYSMSDFLFLKNEGVKQVKFCRKRTPINPSS